MKNYSTSNRLTLNNLNKRNENDTKEDKDKSNTILSNLKEKDDNKVQEESEEMEKVKNKERVELTEKKRKELLKEKTKKAYNMKLDRKLAMTIQSYVDAYNKHSRLAEQNAMFNYTNLIKGEGAFREHRRNEEYKPPTISKFSIISDLDDSNIETHGRKTILSTKHNR